MHYRKLNPPPAYLSVNVYYSTLINLGKVTDELEIKNWETGMKKGGDVNLYKLFNLYNLFVKPDMLCGIYAVKQTKG